MAINNISYSEDEEVVYLPIVYNTKSGSFQITDDPIIINGNIWYTFDTLMYSSISEDGVDQGRNNILSVGDQLTYEDTIYEII